MSDQANRNHLSTFSLSTTSAVNTLDSQMPGSSVHRASIKARNEYENQGIAVCRVRESHGIDIFAGFPVLNEEILQMQASVEEVSKETVRNFKRRQSARGVRHVRAS